MSLPGDGTTSAWPPPGWPACPSRERLEAAIDYVAAGEAAFQRMIDLAVEKFLEGGQITILTCQDAPPGTRDDVETVLAELAARAAAKLIDHDRPVIPGLPAQHPAQIFLRAARLTTHAGIGMSVITRPGRDGDSSVAYGVMHRDPEWAGLCPVLTEAEGLEALVFCDQTHEPDAIMLAPREVLGCDPGELPGCGQREMIGEIPVNQTITEVFRHHGGNPAVVDICRRSNMARSLEMLFGGERQ